MLNLLWRLIWQTPATRRRTQTPLCRQTLEQGLQPSGPTNFEHMHSQGLDLARHSVRSRKQAAGPPASATRLSCSPQTIPSRARETRRAMAQSTFTPSLRAAIHAAAGALQHNMPKRLRSRAGTLHISISTPPQAGPACSSCRALSSPAQKRHNVRLAPAALAATKQNPRS